MDMETNQEGPNLGLWLGIAVGAAIGIGIALSRRKRSPWDQARKISSRITDHSGDLADATSNIVQRVKTIYDEGCKVVEEAGDCGPTAASWSTGKYLPGRNAERPPRTVTSVSRYYPFRLAPPRLIVAERT